MRSLRVLAISTVVTAARSCATHHSSSSSQGNTSSDSPGDSAYVQFQKQQQRFHRHSFYEKGSAAPNGNESADTHNGPQQSFDGTSSSSSSSASNRAKDERVYGHGSATAQERRQVRQQWEKSFFGRLHFEDGMHSRFAEAVAAEASESTGEFTAASTVDDHTHAELFPNWPEDETAPVSEFLRLRPSLQLRYIVDRLSMGERRIRYAVDYGSLSMMHQLNLGELMVAEAETLLVKLGWMNDEVAARIEEMKAQAAKIKYDFDLD